MPNATYITDPEINISNNNLLHKKKRIYLQLAK